MPNRQQRRARLRANREGGQQWHGPVPIELREVLEIMDADTCPCCGSVLDDGPTDGATAKSRVGGHSEVDHGAP